MIEAVRRLTSDELERDFPGIADVMDGEADQSRYEYRAVSVFDEWLGNHRLGELECRGDAYLAKCKPLDRFNAMLVARTTVLRLQEESIDGGLRYCASPFESGEAAVEYAVQSDEDCFSDSFFRLVLPDWRALYLEAWDFTNVFFFRDGSRLEALDVMAREAGVHVLKRNW